MGENEQGGMLRTIIVLGIIAIVSFAVIATVISLKGTSTNHTTKGVGSVVTTLKPYAVSAPTETHVAYTPGTNSLGDYYRNVPIVGSVPPNSWREERFVVRASAPVTMAVDFNNYDGTSGNDHDDASKRSMTVTAQDGTAVAKLSGTILSYSGNTQVALAANTNYTVVLKTFNKGTTTFIEDKTTGDRTNKLGTRSDGRAYSFTVSDFEAATYDAKYVD